jgi:hypothetical protein
MGLADLDDINARSDCHRELIRQDISHQLNLTIEATQP